MKSEEKKILLKKIGTTEWRISYWKMMCGDHCDFVIRECEDEIKRLEKKKARVIADKAIAPQQLEKYRAEYKKLEAQLDAPRVESLEQKEAKFVKLAEKLAELSTDLSGLNLTPEQIEMLKMMAKMK